MTTATRTSSSCRPRSSSPTRTSTWCACIVGNEVVLRGDLPIAELEQLPRPRARCHRAAGEHRRALARLARAPGAGAARGLHRRAPAALLGGRARSMIAVDYSLRAVQAPAEGLPGQADRGRRRSAGRAAAARASPRSPRRRTRRCSCAASSRSAHEAADHLLRHGGLRPALEGVPWRARSARTGACTTSNRQPKFEFTAPIVRIPEWHILAAVSVARGAAAAGRALSQQRRAAQPRPQLPRDGGVRGRDARGVGHLRLHAAVHDRLERDLGRAAAAGHARACCWCCWPRRTSGPRRTGSTYRRRLGAPIAASTTRHAAEGLGARAGLQRAAGRCSSRPSMRSRASTTRTSKCW